MVGLSMKSSGPSICKGRGLHRRQLGLWRGKGQRERGIENDGWVGQYGWERRWSGKEKDRDGPNEDGKEEEAGRGLGLTSEDRRSNRRHNQEVKTWCKKVGVSLKWKESRERLEKRVGL